MIIWTVIQARTTSQRLPRKVLLPVGDKLLIDHVFDRAEQLGPPVAVAIPKGDEELAKLCFDREWIYTEGPEDDVLARYVEAARQLRADHVVRVTADCPFIDVEAGRWTIRDHLDSGADFTAYLAEGRGVEVFTADALERAHTQVRKAKWLPTRHFLEHPDEWILDHDGFEKRFVKFSVDTAEELELARSRYGDTERIRD